MERMKNMGLKKSFVLLSALSMAIALLVISIIFIVCKKIISNYPTGGVTITFDGIVRNLEEPTSEQRLVMDLLGWVQILSCIMVPVVSLGIASLIFYRYKLKEPISVLQMGTERIREHDLDFFIPEVSGDELGQVCVAFETMRAELMQTNQELWRQAEERKRLNAAFSHDLRNPITVLKGTVKLLRQGTADECALERMETYVLRLERYVEAMSSIQRLEQLPLQKKEVILSRLQDEVAETARLLAPNVETKVWMEDEAAAHGDDRRPLCGADAEETRGGTIEQVWEAGIARAGAAGLVLDHGLFLTVAENLIGNAARYAKRRIDIHLSFTTGAQYCDNKIDSEESASDKQRSCGNGIKSRIFFVMTVADDGCGYPAKLVKDGPKPFGRMEDDAEHFGMGLYTSQMLCVKHGGMLVLENDISGGARAQAVFEI